MLRNGYPWKPKTERKKILLLSDDARLPSGVGTVSRELIFGTCHHFNFVQLGAALNHPESGRKIDLSEAITKELGVEDANVFIYPYSGYGDENILRYLLSEEKPDAIVHFTDPRQWIWLYQMESEIRETTPIFYLSIWDDLPYPMWNAPYYASSDLIMSISKQSYGIHCKVLEQAGGEVIKK